FPIRRSSDHSLVGSSPRLIAAPHVLLRLLAPRHPPCALRSLPSTRKQQVSTTLPAQFSRYGRAAPERRRRRRVGPAARRPCAGGGAPPEPDSASRRRGRGRRG